MPVDIQRELTEALRRAHAAAPSHILRSKQLPRRTRVLLQHRGFLKEIIRGWYALVTPQASAGDTTFWHLHFWSFVSAYLAARYGQRYCLSAEHSLDLWTANPQTPKQLIVLTKRGGVFTLELPNGSSILLYPDRKALPATTTKQGLQVMPLAVALIRTTPSYYTKSTTSAELALRMVRVEDLSRALLSGPINVTSAGRIVGALRHLGLTDSAARLEADLLAAGITTKAQNPFEGPACLPVGAILDSPYAGRIEALWARLRLDVLAHFPRPPSSLPDQSVYLRRVNEIYTHDAYNSLSIEGYQVTPELIERIADGSWNPSVNPKDKEQVNAMAAKGYQAAFKAVLTSLGDLWRGHSPGRIVNRDLQGWYRALFSPSVQANILPAAALAGYRERRVFILNSEHVPPAPEAVPASMESLFRMLTNEPSPAVRAVLGHFVFVFIHPYSDGNGRIGRFLMNVMLASGGYNWTVIRFERRREYMAALERASVHGEIADLVNFITAEMNASAKFRH